MTGASARKQLDEGKKAERPDVIKIPLADKVDSLGNSAARLWQLVSDYEKSKPKLALELASRILKDPKVIIEERHGDKALRDFDRDAYAIEMKRSENSEIAKLGSDWLDTPRVMLKKYAVGSQLDTPILAAIAGEQKVQEAMPDSAVFSMKLPAASAESKKSVEESKETRVAQFSKFSMKYVPSKEVREALFKDCMKLMAKIALDPQDKTAIANEISNTGMRFIYCRSSLDSEEPSCMFIRTSSSLPETFTITKKEGKWTLDPSSVLSQVDYQRWLKSLVGKLEETGKNKERTIRNFIELSDVLEGRGRTAVKHEGHPEGFLDMIHRNADEFKRDVLTEVKRISMEDWNSDLGATLDEHAFTLGEYGHGRLLRKYGYVQKHGHYFAKGGGSHYTSESRVETLITSFSHFDIDLSKLITSAHLYKSWDSITLEIATPESKLRREQSAKELRENPERFQEMIDRNLKKIVRIDNNPREITVDLERWRAFMEFDMKETNDYAAVVNAIASERGFETDRIVDKMIEVQVRVDREYTSIDDSKHIFARSENRKNMEKLLLKSFGVGVSSLFLKSEERVDKMDLTSRTAYSIIGLRQAGLPLKLAAEIGSVNPEAGIELSKILLDVKVKSYELFDKIDNRGIKKKREIYDAIEDAELNKRVSIEHDWNSS